MKVATFISCEYNTNPKPWHIQKAPQDTNLLRSELCSNFDLFINVSDNYVVPGGKPLSELLYVSDNYVVPGGKPLSELQSAPEHCSLPSSLFDIYFLDLSEDDLIADFSAPYFGNPNK